MKFLVDILAFVGIIVAILFLIGVGYAIFCSIITIYTNRKVQKELIKSAKKEYSNYVEKVFEQALKDSNLEGK